MFYKLFSLIITNVLLQSLTSQTTFNKIYGSEYYDVCTDIVTTNDGNYIITGHTMGFGAGSEIFALKIDDQGNELWFRKLFGVNPDLSFGSLETSQGALLLTGNTTSFGVGGSGVAASIDESGDLNWSRIYGDESWGEIFYDAEEGNSGRIYLCGYHYSADLWIEKIDEFGISIGSQLLIGTFAYPPNIAATSDNGVAIAVERDGNNGFVIIKLDEDFNIEWSHNFRNFDASCMPTDIISDTDSTLVVLGYNMYGGFGISQDMFVAKISYDGEPIWGKRYGGIYTDWSAEILESEDGYCISGYTNSSGNGIEDFSLIKIDNVGDVEWAYTYGRPWYDQLFAIDRGIDSGYVLAGITITEGVEADSTEIYVVKTDEFGLTDCNFNSWNILWENLDFPYQEVTYIPGGGLPSTEQEIPISSEYVLERDYCLIGNVSTTKVNEISIYPNPINDVAIIDIQELTAETIKVYNPLGQLLRTEGCKGQNKIVFKKNDLLTGVYFLNIELVNSELLSIPIMIE